MWVIQYRASDYQGYLKPGTDNGSHYADCLVEDPLEAWMFETEAAAEYVRTSLETIVDVFKARLDYLAKRPAK
jgi:hypothetical protein